MTGAPPGTEVGLFLDGPALIEAGDLIVTGTGRTYEVSSARRQSCGRYVGRWHLRAVVLPGPVTDSDAVVHTVRWYPR